MSSSWPQLTARTSICGKSSGARVSRRGHRADGSSHDHNPRPRAPTGGRRATRTAPEPTACGEGSRPGFQVGVIRCRALLLGFKHCSSTTGGDVNFPTQPRRRPGSPFRQARYRSGQRSKYRPSPHVPHDLNIGAVTGSGAGPPSPSAGPADHVLGERVVRTALRSRSASRASPGSVRPAGSAHPCPKGCHDQRVADPDIGARIARWRRRSPRVSQFCGGPAVRPRRRRRRACVLPRSRLGTRSG
jgi:hypothetical protein